MKPRVCIISSRIFPIGNTGIAGYGGLEQVAFYQARGLADRGYEVGLVAPDGSNVDGVKVIPTGPPGQQYNERDAYGRKDGGYWPELLNYDVVIDHSWEKWSMMLCMEGRLKRSLNWLHAPIQTMYQTLPPVDKPCMVCISKDQAANFEALHGKQARVAYNGCDPEHYKPMGVKRTDRFLFLARFSSIKGPDIGIKACKELNQGLDLVGDVSITNEPAYFEQCKAQCDDKQIKLVGSCSRGEAVWWMSQAHAFLHPTQRFREPFGLAPVEAQLCGLPVISFNFGAMRETVKHGETGHLVNSYEEFAEAVKAYAGPIDQKLRNHCREWASQFSISASVDQVERLIEEALSTKGGW